MTNKWKKLNERDAAIRKQVQRGLIIGWALVGLFLCGLITLAIVMS